jgi:hypothetical protein
LAGSPFPISHCYVVRNTSIGKTTPMLRGHQSSLTQMRESTLEPFLRRLGRLPAKVQRHKRGGGALIDGCHIDGTSPTATQNYK